MVNSPLGMAVGPRHSVVFDTWMTSGHEGLSAVRRPIPVMAFLRVARRVEPAGGPHLRRPLRLVPASRGALSRFTTE